MDAVELGYPVDVPNVMGSEVFGRARVTVNEVDAAACESNSRVSILVNTSIDPFLKQKDVTITVSNLESASGDSIPESEPCENESQPSNFRVEDSSEHLHFRGTSSPSSVQVQRKAGKMSRSSSRCSKRPRFAQLEDSTSSAGVDVIKDISDNLGPYHITKCNSLEKMQMVKQKGNYNCKRGDKRNFKVPMKAKYDSFTMKAGLASCPATRGNNFFGVYGLKSDILDITKHVDELSLKDLLDGTCECPSLGKDKGKKTASLNENFLHSVRKACSSLPLAKPAQPQNFAEMGSSTNKKLPICPPTSISLVPTDDNDDKWNSCTTEQSSCDKESCSKYGTPVNHLDFQLYQPKDILERLTLPPPKDLEALLLDAAKSSAPSRSNSDMRSAKQIYRRVSLPPFPWSHTFNGHCRTNSDAVKLLTSRSTCQGRWARIATSTTSLGASTDCYTNLESLTYNQSLVPVSSSIGRPWGDWGSSSLATCSKASVVSLESGVNLKDRVNAEHCPRVLAAAQTLCDIATQSRRRNPNGIMRWPKKPSQKVMKAKKSKLFEKPEDVFTIRISQLASDNLVRKGTNQITSSKRPKLSVIGDRKDLNHISSTRKGPINWSTPRSSRSSPNKTVRDPISEKIHSTTNILQQSRMMPPLAKVVDKSCGSRQKLQKVVPNEWDRGRDRID